MGYLQEIGIESGTDKYGHGYLENYESHFDDIRNDVKCFIEIGVLGGKSLTMWEKYFPNAIIHGVDINPSCMTYESERIKIHIGDQSNNNFLMHLKDRIGYYDILVDDGSHITKHQISTHNILYENLKKGGFYCIEDLGNSYEEILNQHDLRQIWPGMSYNSDEYELKNYRRDFDDWINKEIKKIDYNGYFKYEKEFNLYPVSSLHFYPMMLVIKK